MAVSVNDSRLSNAAQTRGIDRERIQTLFTLYFQSDSVLRQKFQELQEIIDEEDDPKDLINNQAYKDKLAELASLGFLYTPAQFIAILVNAKNANQELITYLLNRELNDYIEQRAPQDNSQEHNEKSRGHLELYQDMLKAINWDDQTGTPEEKKALEDKLEQPLRQHQENAEYRQVAARAAFFRQHEIPPPQDWVAKVNQDFGYGQWDGKQPLPDVNLKRKSEVQAEIRIDNIGVSLGELAEIMNQTGGKIEGFSRDGKDNPFRKIKFEFAGKSYTLMAVYDKSTSVFDVKPWELDEKGVPVQPCQAAEIKGWMKGGKIITPTDPADMNVAQAQADALRRLASFSLTVTIEEELEEPEEPKDDYYEDSVMDDDDDNDNDDDLKEESAFRSGAAVHRNNPGATASSQPFLVPAKQKQKDQPLNEDELSKLKHLLKQPIIRIKEIFLENGMNALQVRSEVLMRFNRYEAPEAENSARITKAGREIVYMNDLLDEKGRVDDKKLAANGFDNDFYLEDSELLSRIAEGSDEVQQVFLGQLHEVLADYDPEAEDQRYQQKSTLNTWQSNQLVVDVQQKMLDNVQSNNGNGGSNNTNKPA